jgi:teichuronic acid biosynthesis glycosyltransferase TuaC
MKVLFFSNNFPRPGQPNRAAYCLNLCRAIIGIGNSLRAVSPVSWWDRLHLGHKTSAKQMAGIPVEYPLFFYPPRVMRHKYDAFMWASCGRCLTRAVQEFKPDFILSYWSHPDGAVAARAAHAHGIPAAVIVGGSDVLILAKEQGPRRTAIINALQNIDAVITVSKHLHDAVVNLGIDEHRVHVVYQGVDGNIFHPGVREQDREQLKIDEPMLLFVGNLVPVKGLEVLLNACAILARKGISFRLCLLGQGPCQSDLQALARQLGIAGRVFFMGVTPQKDLAYWYRAADLTVLSSHSEGIPNVLRESMACGTPFVSTDVGGIREITSDPMNRLVPAGDPQALADAIEASLASPKRCTTGQKGTWEESATRLLAIMKPLCEAHDSRKSRCGSAAGATPSPTPRASEMNSEVT